jgi:hypothetical protein
MLRKTRNQGNDTVQRQLDGIQPTTTIATAEAAIRQLTNNDDRMRTEGALDELSGLITGRALSGESTFTVEGTQN